MKTHLFKSLLTIVFLSIINVSFSQNIGINGSGSNPDASALLDVDAASTPSLGILIPRIALQAINLPAPISSPATSLLLYNTTTASTGTNAVSPGYYYWDGTKWVRFAYNASGSSSTAWDLLGNFGTNPTTNFLGTTDAQDLVFRTNNLEAVRVNTLGFVGIGINPAVKLDVAGLSSLPSSGGFIRLTTPGPAQLHFGIDNSTLGFEYAWIQSHGSRPLYINNTNNTILNLLAGGVGIGTTTPAQKLDVVGNVQFSNALMPAGNAGTSGQVLTSAGAGAAPTWTTISQWALLGNAGTTAGTNFLGTTDAQDLVFKTNNTERWRVLQSATPTLRANASSLLITKTSAGTNVVGFNNTASGIVVGDNNNFGGGSSNVIVGNNSNSGGGGPSNNIVLGSSFTTSGGGPLNSIFIGNTIATGGGGPINSIFIGNGINTGGAINTAVIGNTSMTSIGGQVGWSTLSDGRYKKNISDFNLGLNFITKLNPKSYVYNNNDNGIIYNGLIAQEVEKTLQDLGVNFSGLCLPTTKDDHYSIRYGDFVIPLINAVKEQQLQIEELKKQNAEIIKLLKKN